MVASRSVYLALLLERPLALSQLVRLCAASVMITRQIARHPVLLDELLDPRTLYAPLDGPALRLDLAATGCTRGPGDIEREMDALREFKQTNSLRVAAADDQRRALHRRGERQGSPVSPRRRLARP